MICPCGEAKASACIEDCGYGGDNADRTCQTDTFHDHFLLGDQCQTAGDVDVEHQPDADVVGNGTGLDSCKNALSCFLLLGLMPVGRLCKKKVTNEHHHEINGSQDEEHLVDAALAQIVQQCLHDGACDGLCSAEACHGESGRQTLLVLEPEHQCLHGRQVAGTETDTHDEAIGDIDAKQCQNASLVLAAVPDEEAGTCHTQCEGDGGDQGGLVNILLHDIA